MDTRLNLLFNKFLNNQCADSEVLALLNHFEIKDSEIELRTLIMQQLENEGEIKIKSDHVDERLELSYQRILASLSNKEELIPAQKEQKIKHLRPYIAVAAAIALVCFIAGLFYFNQNIRSKQNISVFQNDVPPGKTGATLTLANGKKIFLRDGMKQEVINEAGIFITKTANGQLIYQVKNVGISKNKINTLTTSKGETYQVRLPDGSLVTLNAASSLTYTTALIENGSRVVSLSGEGYFEVAKDKKHPFIVKTAQQEVSVLGTHFNINSYVDEANVKTTLLEGSVQVSSKGLIKILKPGQQSELVKNTIRINEVDVDQVVAWKNGVFRFENQSLQEVMRVLARWYDLDVQYEGVLSNEAFYGEISRDKNMVQVLKLLGKTGTVHFKVQGKKITVSQ